MKREGVAAFGGACKAFLMVSWLTAGPAVLTACGDDGTGPQGRDLCELVSLNRNGNLSVDMNCSGSVTSTISEIRYDPFSRPTSYNFDMRCTGSGSDHYQGSVTNISWNNIGEALGATVTINGTTCSV